MGDFGLVTELKVLNLHVIGKPSSLLDDGGRRVRAISQYAGCVQIRQADEESSEYRAFDQRQREDSDNLFPVASGDEPRLVPEPATRDAAEPGRETSKRKGFAASVSDS